jgi:2-polyprenyl-3-methyl-5-hydroxy-6-metoxy-1,4-benzoquinol methylase
VQGWGATHPASARASGHIVIGVKAGALVNGLADPACDRAPAAYSWIMAVRDEARAQKEFSERYDRAVLPAAVAVERAALGSDHGASGFTTLAQADRLATELRVGPGDRVLDIGSGCGWPGLRVAQQTGCTVVLSDLTVAGVRRGVARARSDGMVERISGIAASARYLPFRPENFDAMVHTDVLC